MRNLPPLALVFLTACSTVSKQEPVPAQAQDAKATVHHEAKGALGPYSALVETQDLVFVAGRIGATQKEFEEEVETTLFALEVELGRVGCTLADLVQTTCYLTDMELYERFNRVYAERVPKPWPARAVVGVSALPAGARVEIVGIARKH
jgi:2-iminobutanoate/2-iminopropanoate deaminase